MPEHSKELSGNSEKIVHLDVDAEQWADLLNFLNNGAEARKLLRWWKLEVIVKTGLLYEFDSVVDMVCQAGFRLLPEIHCNSHLEIFRFAAQHDHLALATYAVSFLGDSDLADCKHPRDISGHHFHDIPGRYTAALFKAMIDLPRPHSTLAGQDWQIISHQFDARY